MIARTQILSMVAVVSLSPALGAGCSGAKEASGMRGVLSEPLFIKPSPVSLQTLATSLSPLTESRSGRRAIEALRDATGLPEAPKNFRFILRDDNSIVSFDCDWGHAHWVSWTVSKSDLGNSGRSGFFHPESRLPNDNCLSPTPADYKGSGFDRGHMTPSGDRTANVEVNGAVFSMANIVPQAARANQRGWNDLENWTRARVREGSEAVVYAGTHGSLGEMSGKPINLPAYTWKVVVVYKNINRSPGMGELPEPTVMAAVFSNESSGPPILMDEAQTTVDEIEDLIGVDLLAGLPDEMERRLESKMANWSFP